MLQSCSRIEGVSEIQGRGLFTWTGRLRRYLAHELEWMSENSKTLARPGLGQGRRRGALVLVLCLIIMALSLFASSPRFVWWTYVGSETVTWPPELNRSRDVLRQLDNPLAKAISPSNRVIQYRLLVPSLAYLLGLPFKLFLALPHLGAVLVFLLSFRQSLREKLSLLEASLIVGLSGTASWFFVTTGWLAYLDSYYILGFIIVAFQRPRWAFVLCCLLLPHINERFILGLPLAMTIHAYREGQLTKENSVSFFKEIALGILIVLPFVLMRLLLKAGDDTVSSEILGRFFSFASLREYPLQCLKGFWHGFRFAWVPVFACCFFMLKNLGLFWKVFVAVVFALTLSFALFLTGDISLTMGLFFPAFVQGCFMIVEHLKSRKNLAVVLLMAMLVGNYLAPAKHVILSFDLPIRCFLYERQQYLDPPLKANPKKQMVESLRLTELGKLEQARKHAQLATVLNPKQHDAHFQLAQILERLGRPQRALEACQTAIKHSKSAPKAQQRYARAYLAMKTRINKENK